MSTTVGGGPPQLPDRVTPVWEGEGFDWSSWDLLDEDDVGHSTAQFEAIVYLLGGLAQWRLERGAEGLYVGSDQFFKLHDERRYAQISPDVYVIEGRLPIPPPKSWPLGTRLKLAVEMVSPSVGGRWGRLVNQPGVRQDTRGDFTSVPIPADALEKDWQKDYQEAPLKYSRLGADELILFDPEVAARRGAQGALFQDEPWGVRHPCTLYRAESGGYLVRVTTGTGPFYSEVLDAWVLTIERDGLQLLALARDREGRDLIPPLAEAMAAERDAWRSRAAEAEAAWQAERERAEAAHERAEAERERAEVAELAREVERERAEAAHERAEAERERAEAERERAEVAELAREVERERAEGLAAELRRLRALLERGEGEG